MPPETVTDEALLEKVVDYHKAAKPFRDFVERYIP